MKRGIVEMYSIKAGSFAQIAQAFGCSTTTVRETLDQAGLRPIKRRGTQSKPRKTTKGSQSGRSLLSRLLRPFAWLTGR